MKPKISKNLTTVSFLLVFVASQSVVLAAPGQFNEGFYLDSGGWSGLIPWASGSRTNLELYSATGGVVIDSVVPETVRGEFDGGVTLWGKPVSIVLGTNDGNGGTFQVWKDGDYLNPLAVPAFKIDTASSPRIAAFNGVNVSIANGSLSVAGGLNLVGTGTGNGLSVNGTSIFSIDGTTGKVTYANDRPLSITSATASTSSITGAVTVSGGIGVAKDSFINGLRIGRGEGTNNSTNTAVGVNVLYSNTTGSENSAVGYQTLVSNTEGVSNSANGFQSLFLNTTGSYNTATGSWSLYSNTTGANNTATGNWALYLNTTGGRNSANGGSALRSNTTGNNNSAIGFQALRTNGTGSDNSAIGYQSLFSTSGSGNSSLGSLSGRYITTGSLNVFLGISAGSLQADGTTIMSDPESSVYIGANARGKDNSDSNSIVIGANAIGEGANTSVLGNAATEKAHVFGQVTLTNTPWKNRPGGTPALADPSVLASDNDGNALVVEGHTVMKGKVTISEAQGDIPMFTGY